MRATRRFGASCATIAILPALAVVFAAPTLLSGAVLLSAWLLTEQYRFTRRLARTVETTTVDQILPQHRESVNASTTVTLRVQREFTALEMEIAPEAPTGVRGEPGRHTVAPTDSEITATFELAWPVAGTFTLPAPTVTLRDRHGRFEETVSIGATPELVVDPHVPRNLRVGAGGSEIAATYGSRRTRRGGSGLDPAGLRKYVPGDPSNRIDWKATARLNETYVREFEAQADRETMLVVDHRATLADGEEGRTKFEYLRTILVAMTDVAERLDDPIGLTTLDEGGITARATPSLTRDQYESIRTRLYELTPSERQSPSDRKHRATRQANTVGAVLEGDTTTYGTTLRPYYASRKAHVERVTDEPLFGAVNQVSNTEETRLFVIATDDTHREELQEAVKLAVQRGNQVMAFLTPNALFEAYALAEMETTYGRYVAFEEFRGKLDRYPRTQAFEVVPGDRLDATLRAGRSRRSQEVPHES
ncbi:putative membrane anchored protein with extracellular vWF domain and Ig-like domain [Halorhabdus sp. SVX81]|uniref:DUF58 domain-containing protein n=1 Tax=Halorhabdus sp. SVX81 TaxID=2978283 RepID=UPI0023D9B9C5|nr:DUF58 domain-containing protein [Halorhabdus sp. SVX81]WEL16719.1 putative membrane anchored protein with extracellular vWF domain and Ig-like domain [Halorhabdus sp. SVX81]